MRLRKCSRQEFNSMRRALFAICLSTACSSTQFAHALPGTTNLSLLPGVTATATGEDFGASIGDAIDGNRDGNFGDGSVFYENANPESPPLFYQVDLGTSAYIDRVQILRRTDADQGVFGNMNLTIYQDDGTGHPGAVAFSHDYLPNYFGVGTWGTTDPGSPSQGGAANGTLGRFVRLERLDNNYWLTFSEFEVIGAKTPLQFTDANDIAIGKPVTSSSPPGYGANHQRQRREYRRQLRCRDLSPRVSYVRSWCRTILASRPGCEHAARPLAALFPRRQLHHIAIQGHGI